MTPLDYLFFIPFSLLYLVVMAIAVIYLYLGIAQLVTHSGRYDEPKRTGGILSLIISVAVMALVSYLYFRWVWLW